MAEWTSRHLHVNTTAPAALDRVIQEVVVPVTSEMTHPWFYIRYWQGGPHIRLRVRDLAAEAVETLDERLAQGMARHGSGIAGEPSIDPRSYAVEAERHARGETGENRTVTALRRAGVHPAVYAPEWERYGGSVVMRASEHLFWRSSVLAADACGQVQELPQRHQAVLRLAEAAADAVGSELDKAVFFEMGRRSWTHWATSYGFDSPTVERVGTVVQPLAPGALTSRPGWVASWRSDVEDLALLLGTSGVPVPAAVISSHVHMTHNRWGLGILDELRTYAILAATYPLPADAEDWMVQES